MQAQPLTAAVQPEPRAAESSDDSSEEEDEVGLAAMRVTNATTRNSQRRQH